MNKLNYVDLEFRIYSLSHQYGILQVVAWDYDMQTARHYNSILLELFSSNFKLFMPHVWMMVLQDHLCTLPTFQRFGSVAPTNVGLSICSLSWVGEFGGENAQAPGCFEFCRPKSGRWPNLQLDGGAARQPLDSWIQKGVEIKDK